eukprot:NODE_310_length_11257_cov_0.344417.p2 type:complete len:860 gc:universal NODE_310_length_11257_cov_0.344417:10359-7780(-)
MSAKEIKDLVNVLQQHTPVSSIRDSQILLDYFKNTGQIMTDLKNQNRQFQKEVMVLQKQIELSSKKEAAKEPLIQLHDSHEPANDGKLLEFQEGILVRDEQIKELQSDQKSKDTEISKLTDSLSQLNSILNQTQAEKSNIQQLAQQSLSALKSELESKIQSEADLVSQIKSKENQLLKLNERNSEIESKFAKLEVENADLLKASENKGIADPSSSGLNAQASQEVVGLQLENEKLSKSNRALRDQLESFENGELAKCKLENEELKSKLSTFNEITAELNSIKQVQLESLGNTKLNDTSNILDETSANKLRSEISELNSKLVSTTCDLNELKSENEKILRQQHDNVDLRDKISSELDKLKLDNQELIKTNNDLNNHLSSIDSALLEKLEHSNVDLNSRLSVIDNLLKQNESYKTEKSMSYKLETSLKAEINQLETSNHALEVEIDQIKQELENARLKSAESERTLLQCQESLNNSQIENSKLSHDYSVSKSTLADVLKKLDTQQTQFIRIQDQHTVVCSQYKQSLTELKTLQALYSALESKAQAQDRKYKEDMDEKIKTINKNKDEAASAYKALHDESSSSVKKLKDELATTKSMLENTLQENQVLHSENGKVQREHLALKQHIDNQINQLTSQNQAYVDQIKQSKQLKEVMEQELRKSIANLESNLSAQQKQYNELQKNSKIQNESVAEYTAVKQELVTFKSQNEELSKQLSSCQEMITGCKNEIDRLKTGEQQLKQLNRSLKDELKHQTKGNNRLSAGSLTNISVNGPRDTKAGNSSPTSTTSPPLNQPSPKEFTRNSRSPSLISVNTNMTTSAPGNDYLKIVLMKFVERKDVRPQLLPVLTNLLNLTPEESKKFNLL